MTDDPATTPGVVPPSVAPPTCEELDEEATRRPKSIRLLPRICRDAFRLVWAAAPRELVISVVLS